MNYKYQDLQSTKSIIRTSLIRKATLFSIYKDLRISPKWDVIGDYPLLHFIIQQTKLSGRKVAKKNVLKLLKNTQDGEFITLRLDSEILKQICA